MNKKISILGISSFYHDSAAAIIVNGKIIAWGKTTEKYLKSKELTVHTTLLKSTMAELIKVLEKSKI